MSTDSILDRALAVPVIGRAAIDRSAIATKNALITQAKAAYEAEVTALRAEIDALRSSRTAA